MKPQERTNPSLESRNRIEVAVQFQSGFFVGCLMRPNFGVQADASVFIAPFPSASLMSGI